MTTPISKDKQSVQHIIEAVQAILVDYRERQKMLEDEQQAILQDFRQAVQTSSSNRSHNNPNPGV